MKDIKDILQERGQVVDKMTKLLNAAEAEGRDLNATEQEQYNNMDKAQQELKARADRIHNHSQLSKELEQVIDVAVKPVLASGESRGKFGAEYGSAFYNAMRIGRSMAAPEILNALQVGTDSEGGYITPESFETALVVAMNDHNEFRQWCNVISTESTRNIPVESSQGTASWTAEEGATTESDAAFTQVVLGAHKLDTIIKVSEELLQDSFFDLEGYLARNFARRFGDAEEAAFVNGDGSGKPTGIVGGSTLGKTTATNAAITADELIDLYHSLKRPYRRNAVFIMNDATCKMVRKLKDGQSQFLWQPGLQAGQPDMLLGRPVIASDGMPTVATTAKSVIFGDLSYYTIADRRGTTIQRLNELYAANGQIGFRGVKRTEGKVTLSEAIKHMAQPV